MQQLQQRLALARQNRALAEQCYRQLHDRREDLDRRFNYGDDNEESSWLPDDVYDGQRKELAAGMAKVVQVLASTAKEEKDTTEQLVHLGGLVVAQQGLMTTRGLQAQNG